MHLTHMLSKHSFVLFYEQDRAKETKIDSWSLFEVLANWYLLVDN